MGFHCGALTRVPTAAKGGTFIITVLAMEGKECSCSCHSIAKNAIGSSEEGSLHCNLCSCCINTVSAEKQPAKIEDGMQISGSQEEGESSDILRTERKKKRALRVVSPSPEALHVWEQSELPDANRMIQTNPERLVNYCVSIRDQSGSSWRHGKVVKYNKESRSHKVLLIAGETGQKAGPAWMDLNEQVLFTKTNLKGMYMTLAVPCTVFSTVLLILLLHILFPPSSPRNSYY